MNLREEGFFTIEDVVQDLNKLNQELVSPNRDQHIENKIIQLSTNITTTMRTETSTIDNSQSRNSNDISSLKQILIMKEIENVVERPKEKEEISSKFIGINENSSLESSSEDDDYLEQQRLHLKLGSNVLFPETCSKEKKKKKRRTKPLEEKKDKGNQNELPIIEKMMQEKIKNKKMQETDEKNALNQFEAGEKFKKQLILEEIERKKNAEREKDLEEMKRLQEKFKSEIEENKKKKKEKRQKDVEDQAIHIAEQKYFIFCLFYNIYSFILISLKNIIKFIITYPLINIIIFSFFIKTMLERL